MEQNRNASGEIITPEQAREIIDSLKVENVDLVYSGKPGCMCGCLGKYTRLTPSDEDDSDVNPRSVKLLFDRITKDPRARLDGNIVHFRTETRQYAVYMKS